MKTKPEEPLHILAFTHTNDLIGLFLVGDEVISTVDLKGGIMTAMLKLLAAYYIFDLEYPRQFSMVMAVLQTFVMEEKYSLETTKKFKFFSKKLSQIMKTVSVSETNEN